MVRPADPDAWRSLLDRQSHVVHLRQARTHGISADAVRGAVRLDQWRRLGDGAYLTHTGPSSPEGQIWAALLRIGKLVTASHDTALWLGCKGQPPPKVHVAVIDSRSVTPKQGIVIHHLPDLGPDRVQWNASPPRTRIETTVLDLLRARDDEDAVVALITRAIRSGATTVERLARAAACRPRMRHRQLVADLLADVDVGAQSPLEVRDLRNDRRHGLPGGLRQEPRTRGARHERLDVVYSGHGLLRPIVKELDGRLGHDDLEGEWRDLDRDNAAETRGESHLRYGWRDLVGRPCVVAAQVAAVLQLNGWRGRPRACSAGCAI